jgi:hypothetical protein
MAWARANTRTTANSGPTGADETRLSLAGCRHPSGLEGIEARCWQELFMPEPCSRTWTQRLADIRLRRAAALCSPRGQLLMAAQASRRRYGTATAPRHPTDERDVKPASADRRSESKSESKTEAKPEGAAEADKGPSPRKAKDKPEPARGLVSAAARHTDVPARAASSSGGNSSDREPAYVTRRRLWTRRSFCSPPPTFGPPRVEPCACS